MDDNNMRVYPNDGPAIVIMGNSSGYDAQTVTDADANVVFSCWQDSNLHSL